MKLNIGCGNDKLEDYVNLDIDPSCNPDLVLDIYDLRMKFKHHSIDQILLFEVLEHLNNPLEALRECHNVIKSDGVVSGSIPNIYQFIGLLRFLRRVNWKSTAPEHINAWRLPEFQNLIEKAGFTLYNYYFFNTHWHTNKNYEFLLPKRLKRHSIRFFLRPVS